jgi:hypothetical protein
LQGKGNESEDEQVMDVLVIFTDNRPFLLQAVAPKTAPGSRADEIRTIIFHFQKNIQF